MPLSPVPDLGSNRRLAVVAVVVTLCVWAMLVWSVGDITKTLGDTDDAMRLARVHDLLAGQGWFDQRVARLQPPFGSVMHWSRLLDVALAALDRLFSVVVSPASAELATRFVWPLLWIGPAVVCALIIARRLGGRLAVFTAAVLLVIDVQLYIQFRPGRVDHHNVQIVMALISAACAVAGAGRLRWAVVAGVATGLGLAIGIEALAFHALIGASYGVHAAFDPTRARAARAYGLTLVAASVGFFALQTPPGSWSLSFCDAIGLNLIVAIAIAGLGLAAVASMSGKASVITRFGMLAAIGVAAAASYLAADPTCLHGPFAAVDPRVRPIWFDRIMELQSWPRMMLLNRDAAIVSITVVVMGVAAAAVLIARSWRDPATLLAAALVGLAGWAASHAFRMDDYAYWFGVPVIAAGLALLAEYVLGGALVVCLATCMLVSPAYVTLLITTLVHAIAPRTKAEVAAGHPDPCLNTHAYAPLAALPPGVVMAPIDLGPFVLALTRDSVLSAPYHRMTWGILAAYEALNAPANVARAHVRGLNVRYIVDCPTDQSDPRPAGLQDDLRRGRVPAWLRPMSMPGQTLRIYRVDPAGSSPNLQPR
jgi:hypothetical protein